MSKDNNPPPVHHVLVTPETAARVLYDNWTGLAGMPSPSRELASQGHFFSALRLLFEPDADLTKPPKTPSPHQMEPVAWQAKGSDGVWRYVEMPRTAEAMGMEIRGLVPVEHPKHNQ